MNCLRISGGPYRRLIVALACLLGLATGLAADGTLVSVEKGEGIHQLLARHGISGARAFDEFVRINKEELGPGNTLLLGRRYRLPDSDQWVIETLLGPRHERVKVTDRVLAGGEFYLVSGHGGPDTGAVGREKGRYLYEDEYAYDVTLRLGRCLLQHGARVHFIIVDPTDGIRDERYLRGAETELCFPDLPIPRDQRERLRQRADAVNGLYAAETGAPYRRCVVIHVDSRGPDEGIDTFFYYQDANAAGRRLAERMRDTFEEQYRVNQPGRGYRGSVETRDLFMLQETTPPTVFVEIGNLQHERDKQRILIPGNREAVARWMCEAILRDVANGD